MSAPTSARALSRLWVAVALATGAAGLCIGIALPLPHVRPPAPALGQGYPSGLTVRQCEALLEVSPSDLPESCH